MKKLCRSLSFTVPQRSWGSAFGALFFLSWFFLLPVALAAGKPLVVNGTAAIVGKQLITIQDARFFRSLQRFRDSESELFRWEEGDELRRTVQKVVLEEMVSAELKSFQFDVSALNGSAEKLIRERRQKSAAKDKQWKELLKLFGKSEGGAIDRLQKSLQVEAFIQKKVETLTPIVTEAEAQRYFQQNQSRFLGNTYEQLKPNIILLLKKEGMQKGLEEWVKFLKDKYAVTNLLEG